MLRGVPEPADREDAGLVDNDATCHAYQLLRRRRVLHFSSVPDAYVNASSSTCLPFCSFSFSFMQAAF